jgi:hypothetical protein
MTDTAEIDSLREQLREALMQGMAQDLQMEMLQADVAALTELNRKMAANALASRDEFDPLVKALHQIAMADDDLTGGPRFVAIAQEALGIYRKPTGEPR